MVEPGIVRNVDQQHSSTHLESGVVEVSCMEPGCTRIFYTEEQMNYHMDFEQHSFELLKETAFDKLRRKYISKLRMTETVSLLSDLNIQEPEQKEPKYTCEMGHALQKGAVRLRYSAEQVHFLKTHFEAGIKNKTLKVTGKSAAEQMRKACDSRGGKRFSPKQYLSADQCQSYLSRQAALVKEGKYAPIPKQLLRY